MLAWWGAGATVVLHTALCLPPCSASCFGLLQMRLRLPLGPPNSTPLRPGQHAPGALPGGHTDSALLAGATITMRGCCAFTVQLATATSEQQVGGEARNRGERGARMARARGRTAATRRQGGGLCATHCPAQTILSLATPGDTAQP